MKVRTILITLSLIACLLVIMGGFASLSYLRKSTSERAEYDIINWTKQLQSAVSTYFGIQQNVVRAVSKLEELTDALVDPSPQTTAEANLVLDSFKDSFGVSVCYLLDTDGLVIASSSRNTPDFFGGKNYDFQLYFKESLAARPWLYVAQDVKSHKRSIYHSHSSL